MKPLPCFFEVWEQRCQFVVYDLPTHSQKGFHVATSEQLELVRSFIRRYGGAQITSTGARLVNYSGVLYNVSGSTPDPKAIREHKGVSWKTLLKRFNDFDDAKCYVTDPLPGEESNHPEFAVGGHMTPNPSGIVEVGGVTYLMPLCKWHNSTARDGTAFHHEETRMLKLTGFMEGDSSITFALRLDTGISYSKLFLDNDAQEWAVEPVAESDAVSLQLLTQQQEAVGGQKRLEYAVFEKRGDIFVIVDSHIAGPSTDETK